MATEQIAAIAHHEAGHAVVAFAFRVRVHRVSIVPNQGVLGRVEARLLRGDPYVEVGRRSESRIRAALDVLLAGTVAEQRFAGVERGAMRLDLDGSEDDVERAERLAMSLAGHNDEADALVRYSFERAKSMVELRWDSITAVANLLLAHREIGAAVARRAAEAAW